MPNKEKVIKAFENIIKEETYPDRPRRFMMPLELAEQVLALLKEQEAVEPFHRCIGKNFSLIDDSYFVYCPYCGKPIAWATQEG